MIKLYTTQEVANATGLTDRTVRRRIESRAIRAVTLRETYGTRRTYGVTEAEVNKLKNSTK